MLRVSVFGAVSVVLASCVFGSGECEDGETRCENNVAMTCRLECAEVGCPRLWTREDCGSKTCILPKRRKGAVCADSPRVDPLCRSRSYCDPATTQIVICAGEYSIGRTLPCGSEGCLDISGGGAQCRVPFDAECIDVAEGHVCLGMSQLVTCRDGRAIDRELCLECFAGSARCTPLP